MFAPLGGQSLFSTAAASSSGPRPAPDRMETEQAEESEVRVEIGNLSHRATAVQLRSQVLLPALRAAGLTDDTVLRGVSRDIGRSDTATVVMPASVAARLVQAIHGHSFGPIAYQNRSLRARVLSSPPPDVEWREARRWPFEDPTAMSPAEQAVVNQHDLELLFSRVPAGEMRDSLWREVRERRNLKEFYLAYGRRLELVFAGEEATPRNSVLRSNERVREEHLELFWPLFERLQGDQRRTGIPGTLHRISRTLHAVSGEPIGVTARVGRTMQGHVMPMLCDGQAKGVSRLSELAARGLLLIGPPNVGKTTVLRELARLLSSDSSTVVVVVDKTLEICGTDKVPHETAIGNARVLTVIGRGGQAAVMIEAIENQSPDVVVVDELSSREECHAARTIAGRGAAVVASIHGDSLAQIVNDTERNIVLGSTTSITLSAKEAEARPDQLRQVQRRMAKPVFGAAIELRGFNEWVLHEDVEKSVDALLNREPCQATYLTRVDESGLVARHGSAVQAAPIIGIMQSREGFAYIRTRKGDVFSALIGAPGGGGPDFSARSGSGEHVWAAISTATPNVWEPTFRTRRSVESEC